MIDFHDIWQKYSKYSRIEFMCFSFQVGFDSVSNAPTLTRCNFSKTYT